MGSRYRYIDWHMRCSNKGCSKGTIGRGIYKVKGIGMVTECLKSSNTGLLISIDGKSIRDWINKAMLHMEDSEIH